MAIAEKIFDQGCDNSFCREQSQCPGLCSFSVAPIRMNDITIKEYPCRVDLQPIADYKKDLLAAATC